MLPSTGPCVCHSDLVGNSRTRAAVIWFVGAAVVGAVAGGLHLLRSQIGGAHQGLSLTLGAFGLTALAAVMLFHGVMLAAQAQDADAAPDPVEPDDSLDEPFDVDAPLGAQEPEAAPQRDAADEPAAVVEEPAAVVDEPERDDAAARDGDTAYDPSEPDGPAVYTFRRGKPVPEPARRADRPPRRDRPA